MHRAAHGRSRRAGRRDALKRLTARGSAAELLTTDVLKSEVLQRIADFAPQALYVSALPPGAVLHASFFCKRVRPRFPDLRLSWHCARGRRFEKARTRLMAARASEVVVSLKDSIEKLPPARSSPQCSRQADARDQPYDLRSADAKRTSSAPSTT